MNDIKDKMGHKVIYFVRHAEDDSRYRGGWSKRPLIRDGELQAIQLCNNIADNADSLNIKTVISSDLPRAILTAAPTAKILSLPINQNMGWRETNSGKLSGMLNSEAKRRYPGYYWTKLEPDEHYPGGESPTEFYERIKREFESIKAKVLSGQIESNVMVFTHSGVINVIYSIVEGRIWTNKSRQFNIPFTSVHACDLTDGTMTQILQKEDCFSDED